MIIRYRKAWGWAFVGVSGMLFLLTLLRFDICVLFSAIFVLMPAYLYLTRPWLKVDKNGVTFLAAIERFQRHYEGRPKVEGKFLVAADGTKVGQRIMADVEDWAAMVAMLEEE